MGQYEAAGRTTSRRWRSIGKCWGRAPDTASSLNNWAGYFTPWRSMKRQGRITNRRWRSDAKCLGRGTRTQARVEQPGRLHRAMGQYRPPAILRTGAGDQSESTGGEHPDTATILNNLGGLFNSMEQYAAAWPYYEQALAILQKTLGKITPIQRSCRRIWIACSRRLRICWKIRSNNLSALRLFDAYQLIPELKPYHACCRRPRTRRRGCTRRCACGCAAPSLHVKSHAAFAVAELTAHAGIGLGLQAQGGQVQPFAEPRAMTMKGAIQHRL